MARSDGQHNGFWVHQSGDSTIRSNCPQLSSVSYIYNEPLISLLQPSYEPWLWSSIELPASIEQLNS